MALPATWTNSYLSYIQNKLAIAYRTRLTAEVMEQYFGDEQDQTKIYYKMANLDDRIQNADQWVPNVQSREDNKLTACEG